MNQTATSNVVAEGGDSTPRCDHRPEKTRAIAPPGGRAPHQRRLEGGPATAEGGRNGAAASVARKWEYRSGVDQERCGFAPAPNANSISDDTLIIIGLTLVGLALQRKFSEEPRNKSGEDQESEGSRTTRR